MTLVSIFHGLASNTTQVISGNLKRDKKLHNYIIVHEIIIIVKKPITLCAWFLHSMVNLGVLNDNELLKKILISYGGE